MALLATKKTLKPVQRKTDESPKIEELGKTECVYLHRPGVIFGEKS